MKEIKNYIVLMIMLVMLIITNKVNVSANENVKEILYSGISGNLTWSIDSNGVLLVEGSGDYLGDKPEWCSYSNYITQAIVRVDNITNTSRMFYECKNLRKMDLSEFDTSKVTDMGWMFYSCQSLAEIDVSGFDTSKVINMYSMFYDCSNLKKIDVSKFDTSNVIDMTYMFAACNNLESIDISGFDTSKVTSMYAMFYACNNLENLDISNFNTSNVTDMRYMFRTCENLKSIDISGFDTSKVTSMQSMFSGCNNLKSIDVSKFNTSKVTSMQSMFSGCNNLKNIDVSKFNTSKVTHMGWMFYECKNLRKIDVSGFDTSKVTTMYSMFYGCRSLTNIDVSNFNTKNVVKMSHMFGNCKNLVSIDVSGFNTSKVTTMYGMFAYCSNLKMVVAPANLPFTIELDGGVWKNENGEECTKIAKNLPYPMTYKKHSSVNNEENKNTLTGTYTGQLQTISTSPFCTITIDNTTYDVTDDFNQKKIIDLWLKAEEKSCQVIYNLINGKIDNIDLFEDCVKIQVEKPILDNASISYDNGKFSSDKVQLSLELSYTLTGGYSLSNESNTSVLVDDLKVSVEPSSGMYLKDGLLKKVYEKTEEAFQISYKNPQTKTFDIYIDNKEPKEIEETRTIMVDVGGKSYTCSLTINNLQKQREEEEDKKRQEELEKATEKVKIALDSNVTVTLFSPINDYLGKSQQKELEKFFALYVAELFMVEEIKGESSVVNGAVEKLGDKLKDKIIDTYFELLGMDNPEITFGVNSPYSVPVKVKFIDENEEEINLDFELKISAQVVEGDWKTCGAIIEIFYETPKKGDNLKESTSNKVKVGQIEYVNMTNFIDGVKDLTKAMYMKVWGDDVDKLIESALPDIIKEVTETLTGGIFTYTDLFGAECIYEVATKKEEEYLTSLKKGETFIKDGNNYKVTNSSTVSFIGLKDKKTKNVTIPNTVKVNGKNFKVTEIANNTLKDNTNIKSVKIGSNVKKIGISAFEGCTKLEKVTVGNNITELGNKSFKGCKKLETITIPSNVTTIGKSVFENCSKLATIKIQSTKLKSVGENSLKGINAKATIKVKAKKLSSYKKLLKGKGQGSKVKIVEM